MEELRVNGERVATALRAALPELDVSVIESTCQIGSGALPDKRISSMAVRLKHESDQMIRAAHTQLRDLRPPVIGRVQGGELLLDTRSVDDWDALLATLSTLTT